MENSYVDAKLLDVNSINDEISKKLDADVIFKPEVYKEIMKRMNLAIKELVDCERKYKLIDKDIVNHIHRYVHEAFELIIYYEQENHRYIEE